MEAFPLPGMETLSNSSTNGDAPMETRLRSGHARHDFTQHGANDALAKAERSSVFRQENLRRKITATGKMRRKLILW